MAHFDRAIPPGGEGKISLRIQTKGYKGIVKKGARVKTNDPDKAMVVLTVKGTVKVPIDISPQFVILILKEGQSVSRVVEIRAKTDKPLKLTPADFSLEGKLKYSIEEIEKGRKYIIEFTTLPEKAQDFHGFLKLKTNYPEKPEIALIITGHFKDLKSRRSGRRSYHPGVPSSPGKDGR